MAYFRNLALIAEEFSDESMKEGANLVKSGEVDFLTLRPTEKNLTAYFEIATEGILIAIEPEQSSLRMACTCEHFADGFFCRHIWAALLRSDRAQLFVSALGTDLALTRFLHQPMTAQELQELQHLQMQQKKPLDVAASLNANLGPKVSNEASALRERNLGVSPDQSLWDLALRDATWALNQTGSNSSKTRESDRGRQIQFVLDLNDHRNADHIVMLIFSREILKKGHTPWRSISLQPSHIEQVEDSYEKEALSMLLGRATPLDAYNRTHKNTFAKLLLPKEFAQTWLEKLAVAGKLSRSRKDASKQYDFEKMVLPYTFFGNIELVLRLSEDSRGFSLELFQREAQGSQDSARELRKLQVTSWDRVVEGLFLQETGFSKLAQANGSLWIEAFRQKESLRVPADTLDRFLDTFYERTPDVAIELPQKVQLPPEVQMKPQARVLFRPRTSQQLSANLQFEYGPNLINADDPRSSFLIRDPRSRVIRDRDVEKQLAQKFHEALDGDQESFLSENLSLKVNELTRFGFPVFFEGQKLRASSTLQMNMVGASGIQWLEVQGGVNFGTGQIGLPQLLQSIEAGDNLVQLSNGELGVLDSALMQKLALVKNFLRPSDGAYTVNRVQALFLASFFQNELSSNATLKNFQQILEDLQTLKEVKLKKNFTGVLRDYQKEGLSWLQVLSQHSLGGVLADDMGLGKTIQILAFLSLQKLSKPALIVAPKSLIFNWVNEFARFVPELRVLEITGSQRQAKMKELGKWDVVLTTYQTLRQDIEEFQKQSFSFFILDEAHFIKNAQAQTTLACRMIQADNRFALTGTPIENSLMDLFSILTILNPGLLPEAQMKSWAQKSVDQLDALSRSLKPFLLRRTKEAVLKDLPEKTEQILYCELSESERSNYEELRNYYWSHLNSKVAEKGLSRSKIDVLEALLRLRQAACHPGLLDQNLMRGGSAKFEVLMSSLREIVQEGHKALVFSQFTSLLSLLKNDLDAEGIRYEYLDGQTTDREDRVNRFQQDGKISLFLLSLKAGGVGLNLTAADYVFILDPWWNPAAETQAIDRAHRIGQTKKVFAYKLVARNTIEEKILELQGRKKKLAEAVVSNNQSLLKNLKIEDLQALFAINDGEGSKGSASNSDLKKIRVLDKEEP